MLEKKLTGKKFGLIFFWLVEVEVVGPSAQPPIGTGGNFPAQVSAQSPLSFSFFWGGRGAPRNLIFIEILLFLLLRSPCKKLKSYDNTFWGNRWGRPNNNKKCGNFR